uniref:Uncharacterized protein n=1 Tax=Romanomermis culicivorax TaxID=13658 RepID=A0A915HZJ0_ROMCU
MGDGAVRRLSGENVLESLECENFEHVKKFGKVGIITITMIATTLCIGLRYELNDRKITSLPPPLTTDGAYGGNYLEEIVEARSKMRLRANNRFRRRSHRRLLKKEPFTLSIYACMSRGRLPAAETSACVSPSSKSFEPGEYSKFKSKS